MARIDFTTRLADNHEAQIKKTLADLEARIITKIQRSVGPTEILSTRIAIDLRKDIQKYNQPMIYIIGIKNRNAK